MTGHAQDPPIESLTAPEVTFRVRGSEQFAMLREFNEPLKRLRGWLGEV